MRAPNYKVGWLVEHKVAALTHFHSEITPEDIRGVFTETQKLLKDVKEPFQLIIDNRLAPLNRIYSLEELQNASPPLQHPFLGYLIVVKPNQLELSFSEKAIQERNGKYLKNAASIEEAFDFVRQLIPEVNAGELDLHFFDVE